jgi:hypothetical protein
MLERERDNRLLNAQAITAALAHEIRQPLAAITTNADAAMRWLGRTPPDHDEVRAALIRIKSGGHRASEVFDGIRSLFGKSGRERQPIDVNRIVLGITNSLQEELNDHGVETRYELTTELPLVNGHGAQLGEVVFNLINNAIEALASTTNRSRMLRVRTEVCGRDEIAVSVQDSGPGIDPRELDNVFNAFVSTKAQWNRIRTRHLPHDCRGPWRSTYGIIGWQERGAVPIRPANRVNGHLRVRTDGRLWHEASIAAADPKRPLSTRPRRCSVAPARSVEVYNPSLPSAEPSRRFPKRGRSWRRSWPGVPEDEEPKPAPDPDPGIVGGKTARVYNFDVARLTAPARQSNGLSGRASRSGSGLSPAR